MILPGAPRAKGRPRFTRAGRTYTDARTREAEQSILAAWLVQVGARAPHDGPVEVELVATFSPPASWPKWKRALALEGRWPHTAKPDLDNLLKVLDGLNGRAWLDDSQIVSFAGSRKGYGPEPSTRVRIVLLPAPGRP